MKSQLPELKRVWSMKKKNSKAHWVLEVEALIQGKEDRQFW